MNNTIVMLLPPAHFMEQEYPFSSTQMNTIVEWIEESITSWLGENIQVLQSYTNVISVEFLTKEPPVHPIKGNGHAYSQALHEEIG